MDFFKSKGKGILLAFCIALPIWIIVKAVSGLEVIGAPILAIVAGMAIAVFLNDKTAGKHFGRAYFADGIGFTSKYVLQLAVILLGFGLNLATVGKVGLASLPIILSTITTSLIVAWILHKLWKIPGKISTLIGVGSSICGGSAIAATAPVIGADDDEIAQSISVIFFFNVIAAVIFPSLGVLLGFSNNGFGLFAGTAINDTSSVTAAASTWDTIHHTNGSVLAYATIVKLTRTLAIIPITIILSLINMKNSAPSEGAPTGIKRIRKIFPMFILYFILASVITTVVTGVASGNGLVVADDIFLMLKNLSKFFIVMAMAAIGLNTDIVKLVKKGGKPIAMGFCCWVAITLVSIAMQSILHIK